MSKVSCAYVERCQPVTISANLLSLAVCVCALRYFWVGIIALSWHPGVHDTSLVTGKTISGILFAAYIHCVPISLIYSELGDIPQLLDTEDMVTMAEPDWKCVYTYLGEFYKRIRDLGLL